MMSAKSYSSKHRILTNLSVLQELREQRNVERFVHAHMCTERSSTNQPLQRAVNRGNHSRQLSCESVELTITIMLPPANKTYTIYLYTRAHNTNVS